MNSYRRFRKLNENMTSRKIRKTRGAFEKVFEELNTLDNIKGVRILLVDEHLEEQPARDFATFSEAERYVENIYMAAADDVYADDVIAPLLDALENRKYDYMSEDGYAVFEGDVVGDVVVFDAVET